MATESMIRIFITSVSEKGWSTVGRQLFILRMKLRFYSYATYIYMRFIIVANVISAALSWPPVLRLEYVCQVIRISDYITVVAIAHQSIY